MAQSIIILAVQDLIDFSNGKPFYGYQIGTVNNAGTSAALYNNEAVALSYVLSNGYILSFVKGFSVGKEYFLSTP